MSAMKYLINLTSSHAEYTMLAHAVRTDWNMSYLRRVPMIITLEFVAMSGTVAPRSLQTLNGRLIMSLWKTGNHFLDVFCMVCNVNVSRMLLLYSFPTWDVCRILVNSKCQVSINCPHMLDQH